MSRLPAHFFSPSEILTDTPLILRNMAELSTAARERIEGIGRMDSYFFVRFLLICLGAWLVWNWTQTVEAIVRYYTPLPAWDYWRVIYDVVHYKSSGISIF